MNDAVKKTENLLPFPPLALGTWTFAGDAIWKESDEKESIRVIHSALDRGITLFDSSPQYGNGRSEEVLGKGLSSKQEPQAAVATKMKIDGKTEKEIIQSVEQSLRRLKRDSIELMQIHWPGSPEENSAALECFMKLKEKGKIQEIGVCNFGVYDLKETVDFPIISNQLPYNFLWRAVEDSIAPLSKTLGKTVWAYSVFQQGLLSGKYRNLESFPEGRMRTRHFSPARKAASHGGAGMENETESVLQGFLDLAEKTGYSPLSLAMNFVSSRQFVDTILFGARTVKQLEEIHRVYQEEVEIRVLEELNRISAPLKIKAGGNPDMFQEISRVRF